MALTPLLTIGCGGREGAAATDAPTTIAVTVQAARVDTVRDTVVVPGQVVPSAAAEQVVTAPEPAELIEAPKAEGDTVQAGDLLARFEIATITADVQARQIELAEATLKYETARAEAARLSSLDERGLIPATRSRPASRRSHRPRRPWARPSHIWTRPKAGWNGQSCARASPGW